jgi:hypothetical protein
VNALKKYRYRCQISSLPSEWIFANSTFFMKIEHIRRTCRVGCTTRDVGGLVNPANEEFAKNFRAVDGIEVKSTRSMGRGLFLRKGGGELGGLQRECVVKVGGQDFAIVGVMDDPRRVTKASWYRSSKVVLDNHSAEVDVKVFNSISGDPVDAIVGMDRKLGVDEKELPADFGIEHRGFIYYDRTLTKGASFDRNGGDFTYNGVPRGSLWYRINHSSKGNVGLVVKTLNSRCDPSLRKGFVFFWKGDGRPAATQLFFDYGDVPDAWNAPS